jgi:hypothetical protein
MKKHIIAFAAILVLFTGCDTLSKMSLPTNIPTVLTATDVANGLKEALNVGTNNAVGLLGKTDGFLKNPLFTIPFPQEAIKAKEKLQQLGMGTLIDNFVATMNHGAENAVSKAAPIFLNAIKTMTITDAVNILKGSDNAATEYFKSKTTASLTALFKPEISKALDAVSCTKYWGDITSTYNKIPLVTPIETDLSKYVTDKAIGALFTQIASEEKKIRTDPAARINDILKKVFDPNAIVK